MKILGKKINFSEKFTPWRDFLNDLPARKNILLKLADLNNLIVLSYRN